MRKLGETPEFRFSEEIGGNCWGIRGDFRRFPKLVFPDVTSEGISGDNVQLFEDEGSESAMDDSDAFTLLSDTFPGCTEDRSIAITYESGTINGEDQ